MTTRNFYILDGEEEASYQVARLDETRFQVTTPGGETLEIDAFTPNPGQLHMLVEGASHDLDVRERGGTFTVSLPDSVHHIEVLNERERRMAVAGVGARGGGGPELVSPMAGKVVAVEIAEGDGVEVGDTVVIIEAMKMENDLKAHKPGVVSRVAVAPGEAVEIGDVLIEIDDE